MRQLGGRLVVIAVALVVAGCQSLSETSGSPSALSLSALQAGSDDVAIAKRHFRKSNYGLAERHYRRAVEARPEDAEAWVGLGASYDQLRRFELADRAYQQAVQLIGRSPEILNNQGYSYMLRGEYEKARAKLLEAQTLDPDNPYIETNLAQLGPH